MRNDANSRPATDKMLDAQIDAASGMLAALRRVMAEADFGDETLALACQDAIREAEAAGIVAADC